MTYQTHPVICHSLANRRTFLFALLFCALAMLGGTVAPAQTFTVLHQFTGSSDGSNPYPSLAMDRAGNLYGVAAFGGLQTCETSNGIGCGTAFKLTHRGSGWVFSPLYEFKGYSDGAIPIGSLTIAQDGSVYGTTDGGGQLDCRDTFGDGCGTVFRLQPPASACATAECMWTETQLYHFTGGVNGNDLLAGIVLDGAGNLYGTAYQGGASQWGLAYEVSRSGSGWTETTLHSFAGGTDGAGPTSNLVLIDNYLYGTTEYGGGEGNCSGGGCGTVFQLAPSGSGYNASVVYNFPGADNTPLGGLAIDASGEFVRELRQRH